MEGCIIVGGAFIQERFQLCIILKLCRIERLSEVMTIRVQAGRWVGNLTINDAKGVHCSAGPGTPVLAIDVEIHNLLVVVIPYYATSV